MVEQCTTLLSNVLFIYIVQFADGVEVIVQTLVFSRSVGFDFSLPRNRRT